MSAATSAVDAILTLRVGEAFTLRGRRFTRSCYRGSFYEGRIVIPVWNERGREVHVTVRDADRVERA